MCTIVTIFSALLFTENSALVISIYNAINLSHFYNSANGFEKLFPWPEPNIEDSRWLIHHNDFDVGDNGGGVYIKDFPYLFGRGKDLDVEIKSNNFNLNTVWIGILNYVSEDALISNNKFSGNALAAILADQPNRMVVLGDNINGMTSTAFGYPIVLWYGATNCTVVGNAKTSVLDVDLGNDNILTGVNSNEGPIGPEINYIISERLKKLDPYINPYY